MLRSGCQSEMKLVFSSQESSVLIYRSTEGMSRPCPVWDLNPRPVKWERDVLPLSHRTSHAVVPSGMSFLS
ncbi:hypothetical protein TNCV_2357261 [Trichonephila clavipes]|nr:hypothetical protein TNCV_2357261 [Trichonephila clavipes]